MHDRSCKVDHNKRSKKKLRCHTPDLEELTPSFAELLHQGLLLQ